jgi:hypothetical protein
VGDALGIGLFNALRESGALANYVPGSANSILNGGGLPSQSRRSSLFDAGDLNSFILPVPTGLALGGASQGGKPDEAADAAASGGNGGEGGDGSGGGEMQRRQRTRRSSIVGPPLSPGEIEQVVGSFEVDEKVTASATVAT